MWETASSRRPEYHRTNQFPVSVCGRQRAPGAQNITEQTNSRSLYVGDSELPAPRISPNKPIPGLCMWETESPTALKYH
ncbi:hypothetical protein FKM82_012985 [Ascaphus truei]